jgi:hypothetical protein
MKWLLASPGVADRGVTVFEAKHSACKCGHGGSFETLALVGRFRALALEGGARMETGGAGFLRVFAAESVVSVPNPDGLITFKGAAA